MDFPFVAELLEYWLDYPPTHVLLKAWTGYERKGQRDSDWRSRRAEEMGDHNYKPSEQRSEKDELIARDLLSGGVRHVDCAPPHVQQAIERAKKGEHFMISGPA